MNKKINIKPYIDLITKKPLYSITILILLILLIIFKSTLIKASIISLFILLGGISKIYHRYVNAPVGFELILFSTVVSGYAYGPLIGSVVGVTSFALATYFSNKFTVYIFPSFIIYFLAGFLASFFNNITIFGLVFEVIYVTALSYISIKILKNQLDRTIIFAVTSLIWNFWIFTSIAPKVVNLIF